MKTESRLRILVLGCGSIGQRHVGNLVNLNAVEVLACDPEPARLEEVAEQFSVATFSSAEQAWSSGIDAVVLAVPTQLHVVCAIEAARRGCHVFVEKPLSHCMDGTDALCAELLRRSLVSMVACNMRFHFGPRTIKQWLDNGIIGQVIAARLHTGSYLPRWRPQQDYRQSYSAHPTWGGAILDCIHEIDLALWYLGDAQLAGACTTSAAAIGLQTDGLAELTLQHDSGAISSVHLNFIQRDYRRTCQIIGTDGTISWDMEDGRVRRYGPDGKIAQSVSPPPEWNMNQMYVAEMSHFIEAVNSKTPTVNPIPDARAALRLALESRTMSRELKLTARQRNRHEHGGSPQCGHHSSADAIVTPAGQSAR